jgi:hypothetical protein
MAADFRKMLQTLVGLREAIRFPGDIYVLFGLSSAVFWYGGWPFLKGLFTHPPRLRRGGAIINQCLEPCLKSSLTASAPLAS